MKWILMIIAYSLIGLLLAMVKHRVQSCEKEELFIILLIWPIILPILIIELNLNKIMKWLEWNTDRYYKRKLKND